MRGRKYGHIFTKMLAWMLVLVVLCTSVPMDGMRVYAEEDVNLIDENSDMLEDNFSESEEQNTKEESVTTNIVEELISEESDESLEEDRDFLSTTIDACFATADAPDESRFGTSSEGAPTISVFNTYSGNECFGDASVKISSSKNAQMYYIYTSDSKDGEYSCTRTVENSELEQYNNLVLLGAPVDPKTGNNKAIYVKVVMQDQDGNYTSYSNIASNGNSSVIRGPEEDITKLKYRDICFLDENNQVIEDCLTLHVGESKRVHLGLVDKDGKVQDMDQMDLDYFDEWSELWEFLYRGTWIVTYPENQNYDTMYGDSIPMMACYDVYQRKYGDTSGSVVKYELTDDNYYEIGGWFTGVSVPSTDYYVQMVLKNQEFGYIVKRLKVEVVQAENNVSYQKCPTDRIITDESELSEAYRNLLISRTAGPIIASTEAIEWFNMDSIFDFYAERDGMKPWEGDYLHWTIGDPEKEVFSFDYYNYKELDYYGTNYYAIYNTTKFITTVEQEQWVTDEINKLLSPGGALYSAAQSNSDETKAKAAYDYVVKHVSGKVGSNTAAERRKPINHTAYGALKNGYGTCQAFALLYTRLTRELGLPSKLIMGNDANAHTYNIVKINDYWWYVDCSAGIYKKGYKEFKRAAEQPEFGSFSFLKSYISKIYGYENSNSGKIDILDNEGNICANVSSFMWAKDYIGGSFLEAFSQGKTEADLANVHYTIKLNADFTFESSTDFNYYFGDIGDLSKHVTVDLNQHTVTAKKYAEIKIDVGLLKNGTIKLDESAQLELGSEFWLASRGLDIQNLKVVGSKYNVVQIVGATMDADSSMDKIYYLELYGSHADRHNDKDFYNRIEGNIQNIDILNINGNNALLGDVTTKILRIEDSWNLWYSNGDKNYCVEVELNNVNVLNGSKIVLPSVMNIHGNVKLSGKTMLVEYQKDYNEVVKDVVYDEWNSPYNDDWTQRFDVPNVEGNLGPMHVNLVRDYGAAGNLLKQGKLTLSGEFNGTSAVGCKPISFKALKYVNGAYIEEVPFSTGDCLFQEGTLKIAVPGDNKLSALTSENVSRLVSYYGEEQFPTLEIENHCVNVSGPFSWLNFNATGGNCSLEKKKIYQGNVYGELPMPTRTGCTFLGWFTQPESGDQVNASTPAPTEITVDTPSITIYAHWATTINYVLDGGTNSPENPEAFKTGDSYVLAKPTKTGYTFLGWFTKANGAGEKIETYDASVTATTLYAYWQANKYTIEYKINNENAKGSMVAQSMTYGVSATLTNVGFTCDKATFIGWNTSADGNGNLYVNKAKVSNLTEEPNGTVTLYAQWKPTTYNIKYDANASSVGGKATGKTANSEFTFFNLENKTNINGYKIVGANFL